MSRYTDAIPEPLCRKKNHKPAGTVSNQPDGYDPERAHASTVICARVECQDDAREWVLAHTREKGVFRTFEQNRARAERAS